MNTIWGQLRSYEVTAMIIGSGFFISVICYSTKQVLTDGYWKQEHVLTYSWTTGGYWSRISSNKNTQLENNKHPPVCLMIVIYIILYDKILNI